MRAAVLAAFLLVVVLSPSSGGVAQASSGGAEAEALGRALVDLAESKGALGVYFDHTRSTYVVVVPAANRAAFTAEDARSLGVGAVIEPRDIDQATIDAISSRLEVMRAAGSIPFDFGFGFDPAAGVVELLSDGPEETFTELRADFPGKISVRPGKFFTTGMHDDTAPFAGGADLNGDLTCTSGFTMRWANGSKRMITAGHCFYNVDSTQTNMGQGSISGVGAWPDYDIGEVSGSQYEGYVWTATNTKRKVSDGANPVVGGYYCTSGRTTGVKCNWEVTQMNVTMCFTGYPACWKSLAAFKRYDDAHIDGGDSGGAFWTGTVGLDGELRAGVRGTISARFWDIYSFSWRSYATQYGRIASELGGTAYVPS